jgi:hypothetical protein
MRRLSTPVFAMLLAVGFVAYLAHLHFTSAKRIESLYTSDSSDDPNGASAYQFMRTRNPATNQLPYNMRAREMAFAATLPQHNENERSATQWQNRGPYNLGGRTRSLALDVTNENIVFAGQVTGGMWRSVDSGAHFTQITTPQQLHSTTCIVQDKRTGHTNTWYYGTGEQYAVVNAAGFVGQFAGDGIFKSTDGGLTWALLPSTMSDTIPNPLFQPRNFDFVWQIATDNSRTDSDIVYAAVVNGIFRSADGGNTWVPVLGLDTANSTVAQYSDVAVTPTGVIYATISDETGLGGYYRTTDGFNWTNITPPTFPTGCRRTEIGIAPTDETQLYFISETPGTGLTGHSLYKYKYLSGNGTGTGCIWSKRTANIPDDHCTGYYTFDFKKYSSQNSYDMFIAVSPLDTNIVYLGGTNIYRSTSGFDSAAYTWMGGYQCDTANLANYVYPHHHPDQHRLVFLPSNPDVAYSATDGGVMKTYGVNDPVVSWELINNGYNTGQFYGVAVEPGNTNSPEIVGGLQDNGSYFTGSLDFTQPWPKVFYGDGGYCAITHGRTNYYLSWEQGHTFKLAIDDNGNVNGLTRIDPKSAGDSYLFVAPFILNPADDNYMYLAYANVIYRNDSLSYIPITGNQYTGITQGWKVLTNSGTVGQINPPYISTLKFSDADPDLLYFGTNAGQVYKMDSVRTSTTSPRINITDSLFPAGAYVSSIEPDRLNANNVLLTFSNYEVISVWYTTDGGQTWADVSGNLEENPDGTGNGPSVNWGTIYNDGATKMYYVGTSIGLFSTDTLNGLNTVWTQEGPNTIGNVVVDMMTARAYDGNIVVGTHGNGVYSNQVFTPSAIATVTPDQLHITTYPNPFNNNIIISLNGITKGFVEADVYDLNGKLIRKLSDTNTTQLTWNGLNYANTSCATGTYLIKVTSGGKSAFSKVVKVN